MIWSGNGSTTISSSQANTGSNSARIPGPNSSLESDAVGNNVAAIRLSFKYRTEGYETTGKPSNRDAFELQLFVNGSLYTSWRYEEKSENGFSTITTGLYGYTNLILLVILLEIGQVILNGLFFQMLHCQVSIYT